VTIVEPAGAVRCAPWARSVDLSPAGTAGTHRGFAIVDWPLPWSRDIGEMADLVGVVALAGAHRLRLQARVPTLARPRRVTVYRSTGADGSFVRYHADETASGSGSGPDTEAALRLLLDRPAPEHAGAVAQRGPGEVLVCTHGRRDTCCGSSGTALFAALTGTGPSVSAATVRDRPVGRTSHTGGHRFAPTVLLLPEGTAWAFADTDLLQRVVTRTGPIGAVASRYRGCTGLGSPAVQCVEGAVLAEMGWPLLDAARRGEDLGDGRVRLSVDGADGTRSVWEAEVVAGRTVSVPDCGRPLDEARKTETERVVHDLRRVE
jgi:hypothetical protein